jgi:hypothetical protein
MADWDKWARAILSLADKQGLPAGSEIVLMRWRGYWRFGNIVPLDRPDLMTVSVTTEGRWPPALYKAMQAARPSLRVLAVDDEIDLTDRLHVLAIEGDRLLRMTPEQTDYAALRVPIGAIGVILTGRSGDA